MTHTEERQERYRDGYDAGFEDGREEGQRGGMLAGLRAALAAVRGEPGLEDTDLYSDAQRDAWQARAIADATAIERLLEQKKGEDDE